jgi:hypothetical protein
VRDDNHLGVLRHLLEVIGEPLHIAPIERRVHLVQHTERAGFDRHKGEQERRGG